MGVRGSGAPQAHGDGVVIKAGGRVHVVPATAIDWMQAADNYVQVHAGPAEYMVRGPLAQLETRLDPGRFVRIHRCSIVNCERIMEVRPAASGDSVIVLQSGVTLRLSRSRREQVLRRIMARAASRG